MSFNFMAALSFYLLIILYYINFNVFLKKQKCAAAKCTYMDLYLFLVSIKLLKYRKTPNIVEEKVRYCVSEIYFCLSVSAHTTSMF